MVPGGSPSADVPASAAVPLRRACRTSGRVWRCCLWGRPCEARPLPLRACPLAAAPGSCTAPVGCAGRDGSQWEHGKTKHDSRQPCLQASAHWRRQPSTPCRCLRPPLKPTRKALCGSPPGGDACANAACGTSKDELRSVLAALRPGSENWLLCVAMGRSAGREGGEQRTGQSVCQGLFDAQYRPVGAAGGTVVRLNRDGTQ